MDVYCPVCSEPFDTYEFHDVAEEQGVTFRQAYRNFVAEGCKSINGGKACAPEKATSEVSRGSAFAVMAELLGDDIDGAAAMLDDMLYVGLVR